MNKQITIVSKQVKKRTLSAFFYYGLIVKNYRNIILLDFTFSFKKIAHELSTF